MTAREFVRRVRRVAGVTLRPPMRTVNRPLWKRPAPSASQFARFGEGSRFLPPSRVDGAAQIVVGDGVTVLEHATIRVAPGARLVLGDGCTIGAFALIVCAQSIEIGPGAAIADRCSITDTLADAGARQPRLPSPAVAPVVIGAGARLGVGTVVAPGSSIGERTLVAAGSCVDGAIPAGACAAGNPAAVVATA